MRVSSKQSKTTKNLNPISSIVTFFNHIFITNLFLLLFPVQQNLEFLNAISIHLS